MRFIANASTCTGAAGEPSHKPGLKTVCTVAMARSSLSMAALRETVRDGIFLGVVFVNWIITAVIVDAAAPDSLAARKGVSIYVAIVSLAVNGYSFGRSFSFLGGADAPTESIFGLFAEILNLTQLWGTAYAAARYWSLPETHAHMSHSLLHAESESIFEMSLVQAGVGWSSEAPVTLIERLVAWLAAYVGGLLLTNIFLLSIVISRRGYWERAPAGGSYTLVPTSTEWKVSLAKRGTVAA